MGGKKRKGFLCRWIRSDLPDREESSQPVQLLSIRSAESPQRPSPSSQRSTGSTDPQGLSKQCSNGSTPTCNHKKPAKHLNHHQHEDNQCQNQQINVDQCQNQATQTVLCPNQQILVSQCANRQSISFPYPVQQVQTFPILNQPIESSNPTFLDPNQPIAAPRTERHRKLLSQLNERFRKTLSLDSGNRGRSNSRSQRDRPKSMVTGFNNRINNSKTEGNIDAVVEEKSGGAKSKKTVSTSSVKKQRFRPKSFFSLETFLDSRRSEASSVDDFQSSKYCKFYLDSAESSPLFKGRATPDLLDVPGISNNQGNQQQEFRETLNQESLCKKRLDKLENHFNRVQNLKSARLSQVNHYSLPDKGPNKENERTHEVDENKVEAIYSEPFYTSQSTLVIGAKETDKKNTKRGNKRTECCSIEFCGIKNSKRSSVSTSRDCTPANLNRFVDVKRPDLYEISIEEGDVLINDRTKDLVVKTMDKSVDSIGSCSLDVDATDNTTDYSDTTSGSLNILTPSSTASHFKDFTSRLQDRARICGPVFDPALLTVPTSVYQQPKKPSYLHLACSVNGYSNITTYDSKLRQKLNKSREASPGRPGNTSAVSMLRDCTDEAMAQRLNSSSKTDRSFFKTSFSETSISSQQNVLTFSKSNGQSADKSHAASKSYHIISNGGNISDGGNPSKSFIQQRVERLYGPGALAQGFFNQKRQKTNSQMETERILNGASQNMKSPEMTIVQSTVQRVLKNGGNQEIYVSKYETFSNGGAPVEADASLPVLRHLRPEFRAQLPILSPKRSAPSRSAGSSCVNSPPDVSLDASKQLDSRLLSVDVVDRAVKNDKQKVSSNSSLVTIIPIEKPCDLEEKINGTLIDINLEKLAIINPKENLLCSNSKTNDVSRSLDDNCNQVVEMSNGGDVEPVSKVKEPQVKAVSDTIRGGSDGLPRVDEDVLIDEIIRESEKAVLEQIPEGVELDGHYFLILKRAETDRLIALAESAERDLEILQAREGVNEEVLGFLRAAAGKARLLATQKMQQFEGLCYNNINRLPDEAFPTTGEDLRGFWDMVSLQVRHVQQLYRQLQLIRKGDWQQVPILATSTTAMVKPPAKQVRRPAAAAPRIQTDAAAKARAEQRRAAIQEARRKREAKGAADQEVEIFAPAPSEGKPADR